MRQLSKLLSLIKVNLKNIASNYIGIISFCVITLLLSIVCSGLIRDYEKKSSIPIGIVDLDNSTLSKTVVDRLSALTSVVLQPGTEEEQMNNLRKERIYAYFVINNGFEESVNHYEFSKLVKMVYLGQNQYASILSDLFAQAMIKDIVIKEGELLHKTFPQYDNLVYSIDYNKFIDTEYENQEEAFAFKYKFYNITEDGAQSANDIANNIISTELFLALSSVFLAFFIMQVITSMDKSLIVEKRTRLSTISSWTMELADHITLILIESVMAMLVVWYLVTQLSIPISTHLFYLISLVSSFMLAVTLLFTCLRRHILSKIGYQFVGFLIILSLGSISILGILGQFQSETVSQIVKKIPNYWFIGGITDIILGVKTIRFTDIIYTIGILVLAYGLFTFIKFRKLEK